MVTVAGTSAKHVSSVTVTGVALTSLTSILATAQGVVAGGSELRGSSAM